MSDVRPLKPSRLNDLFFSKVRIKIDFAGAFWQNDNCFGRLGQGLVLCRNLILGSVLQRGQASIAGTALRVLRTIDA